MSKRNLEPQIKDLQVQTIRLDRIEFHEKNSDLFEEKNEEYIRTLSIDMDSHGLHEPISVKYNSNLDTYICLSGENRIKAARLLGWISILGYVVSPEDELAYMISRNLVKRQVGLKGRIKIYKVYCPEFLNGSKVKIERLKEISVNTGISIFTLKGDLKKIRRGSTKEETLESLIELWKEKKIKGLRVNLCGLPDGNFLLKVAGRNLNYEWRGNFKTVVRECAEAARSKYFNKNFKPENSEFANRIKQLRKDAGLTQFQLSQALGYSQSYLAELEGGKWECSNKLFESIAIYCQERAA
ncbi:helix-turn-helix domain-containing protein [Leptospira sp. FAT1]|nr:helix-turn-helix domain-containing protein [Leptospira sanjuanensis]MCG6170256.1 helix-turn-helix domain-containing protein [Leptospira sanjuanensis]